jgi:hypothetical protein
VRIDVARRANGAAVAMEIDMADVPVGLVGVQGEVDMRDRASLVFMLVGMGVVMSAAVSVCVDVHSVGMIGVGSVRVILVGKNAVRVIAVAGIQMV